MMEAKRQRARRTRKLSILFICGNLGVGGKERQLIELINGLSGEKYEMHLLVKKIASPHVDKIKNKLKSLRSLERAHFRMTDPFVLAKHIDALRPDVVATWSTVVSHFCLLAQPLTAHSYVLLNCSIRNAPIRMAPRYKIERFLYRFYPHVVANSYAGLAAYGQRGRKGRHVLYNGFSLDRVPAVSKDSARAELGLGNEARVWVVMVASLTAKKDHENFIRAAKICQGHADRYQFYLVGDGGRRAILEERVQDMALETTVEFLGRRDDVELILKAADISVLTSTAHFGEGISNTIIESLACGVPTIATDSPGTREIIQDGQNGLIVQHGNSDELARAILAVSGNQEKLAELSLAGQKTVQDVFSMAQCVQTFEEILKECTANVENNR